MSPSTKTVVLACLLMAGCTLAIDQEDIDLSTKACADHKGIRFVWTTGDKVLCQDGYSITYVRSKR